MKFEKLHAADISAKDLAEILDLTTVRVSQLCTTGIIPNNGTRGRYSLFDAVPAYLDYLRANKGDAAAVQLTLARAKKLELENDRRKNELVKTSDAAAVFRAASASWRNEASKLPQRVARRIAKSEDPSEIREILCDELDQVFYRFEKGLQFLNQGTSNESENKVLPISRRVTTPAR